MKLIFHQENLSFRTSWRWGGLLVCHAAAAVLLLTFFLGPMRPVWEWMDESVFLALNGSLATCPWWQRIAAFSNMRLYDKLSTIFLVFILLGYIFYGRREKTGKRFTAALFIGLAMLFFSLPRRELGLFEYDRVSPSRVVRPFYDLKVMYPEMNPKTDSENAFPGDHAIASFLFVALFWHFAGWKAGLATFLLTPFFIVPRMIGGAHWLSDAVVGGGFYTLIVLSWVLFTPFCGWCCRLLYGKIQPWEQRYLLPLQDKVHSLASAFGPSRTASNT